MKRLALGLLLLSSAASYAATPTEMVEQFLQRVTTPQSDQAYDQLFSGSGFAEQKPQELAMVKSQTKSAMSLYGKPIGFEKIREDDLSPSVKRLVYVQKFEGLPVAWEFYFYKPHEAWHINTIRFKDQVASILGSGE